MDSLWYVIAAAVAVALLVGLKSLMAGPLVSAAEARRLVAEGASLVDVRTPGEFAGGHLPGAVNIPVQDFDRRKKEIATDKPVVLYCASGMRSGSAASMLRAGGRTDVHNLGGMARWGN